MVKNLYPGINPHLNSALQSPNSDWETFHSVCIGHLGDELEAHLPEYYYVKDEKSIQIRTLDISVEPPEIQEKHRNIPDVMVFRENQQGGATTAAKLVIAEQTATLVLPIETLLSPEDELRSIVVYDERSGKPITRFELLSPANKPPSSYFLQYRHNRFETLLAGLRLVEIDWLHEFRPILPSIPDYTQHEADAYPYSIIVSDPRPTLSQGRTLVYGRQVADPQPTLALPLENADTVIVNFNHVYHQTYESRRIFTRLTDYSKLPERFETYNENDRAFIERHMKMVVGENV